MVPVAAACSLGLAALSMAVARPAPSYDPWAWLLWGREVAGGRLDTLEGPSLKPLAVAVCALLAPLGDVAPVLWVLVARTGAVLAACLAFRIARRLAGGSAVAGTLAAAGVVLGGHYLGYAASGLSEGVLLALALGGAEAWRAGRPRTALACAVGCGLLRVETWPFLAVAGARAWRARRLDPALLVAAAVAVPAAWLVPELVGSGEAFRSAARARIPNPGQPALADVPVLASLEAALRLPLWPLWAGAVLLARRAWGGDARARGALVPALVGLAWIAVVAAMAQAGFSGEPRYALPGATLVAVSGAAGLALVPAGAAGGDAAARRWRRGALAAAVALVVVAAAPRVARLDRVRTTQAHHWALQADLTRAVTAAGGRDGILDCGRPYVGRLRGPLLAYRLGVAKHVVEPDRPPAAPGVVFRSRIAPGAAPAPAAPPGFSLVGRSGEWEVHRRCAERAAGPASLSRYTPPG